MANPVRRFPPVVVDVAIAAVLGAVWFGASAYWRRNGWLPHHRELWDLAGGWSVLALALRRVAPLAVGAATFVVYPLVYDVALLSELHLLPLMIAGAAAASGGLIATTVSLFGAGVATFAMTTNAAAYVERLPLDRIILNEMLVLGVISMGALVRRSRDLNALLIERNVELERLRAVETAAAVTDERTRIARELHDVVAHHLTAVVVRTQAATHVSQERSPADQETLEWVTATAREALDATRHTVRALRSAGTETATSSVAATRTGSTHTGATHTGATHTDAPHAAAATAPLTPAPRLADILAAADRVQAAGVAVTATLDPGLPTLDAATELAVVRIAQEGLTNVMKHSGASRAHVSVRLEDGQLVVSIDDDGTSPSPTWSPQPGSHGFIGLTERASSCGGTLEVAASDMGGWSLIGRFPLRGNAASPVATEGVRP